MTKNPETSNDFIKSFFRIVFFVVFSIIFIRVITHFYPAPSHDSYEYTTTESGEEIIQGFFR
jgi:hypothetical protein